MKKIFYKFILPIKKIYWFIFRPKTYGVKALIEYNGKFLMIRNSYGHKHWTFPGGGKKKDETPEAGAKREALEEVGILLESLISLGAYFSRRQHKRDTVYCFYSKVDNDFFQIDNKEIEETNWFTLEEIPKSHSAAVEDVFALYEKYQSTHLL
jgi:ADP-ribose pyrophosphatase YjhB (NUDIX family)